MKNTREKGKIGEKIALEYLKNKGYKVLFKNYTVKGGEIDLVLRDDNYLVFVEVKMRISLIYGVPRMAVDKNKCKHLLIAAEKFLYEYGDNKDISSLQPRFDCIEIILSDINNLTSAKIEHLINIDVNC